MYLNKATIVGNLTRDPEMKTLPSGQPVTSFGMATNRYYKDKNGNRQDAVDYHNLVAFGKQAELIAQYLRKGSQALVEGRIQTRSWDKDGQKQYRTEIIVETVQFGQKPETENETRRAEVQREIEQRIGTDNAQPPEDLPENELDVQDIPF